MLDTHGNAWPGKPRNGHEVVEYQKVKAHIVELLDQEVPDHEISARVGLAPSSLYQLKKRILKEVINTKIAERVAARELMRLHHQEALLIKYMNSQYATGEAPDAAYINAFVNISRRVADLIGADAAIAISVEHIDSDRADMLRNSQVDLSTALNRFYTLGDRLVNGGIGSGLTEEERQREMANLLNALGPGADPAVLFGNGNGNGNGNQTVTEERDADGNIIRDAEVVDDEETDEESDEDNEDNEDNEVIELDLDDPPTAEPEMVKVRTLSRNGNRILQRDIIAGRTIDETPGRWVRGGFVSWWHDFGEEEGFQGAVDFDNAYSPYMPVEDDDIDDVDVPDASSDLDGPP